LDYLIPVKKVPTPIYNNEGEVGQEGAVIKTIDIASIKAVRLTKYKQKIMRGN